MIRIDLRFQLNNTSESRLSIELKMLSLQAILLTTVVPLNRVKLDVPTAPDQVTSNEAPAVRPSRDPVNARAATAPRIPKTAIHNCRTPFPSLLLMLENGDRNILKIKQTYE